MANKKFTIFLASGMIPGTVAMVELRADELQFAGDTMIVWCEGRNVAQFKNWSAWIENRPGDKAEATGDGPRLASVTPLRQPVGAAVPAGMDPGAPDRGPRE